MDKVLEDYKHLIQKIAEGDDTLEAIKDLDKVWAEIDDVNAVATSAMRNLLFSGKFSIPMANPPDWLLTKLGKEVISEGVNIVNNLETINCVKNLICALLAKKENIEIPDIFFYSTGKIIVDFSKSDVMWVVTPSRIPWPGVQVKIICNRLGKNSSKVYHQAFGVIEHTLNSIND